jgi:hypothetical protein
MHNHEECNHELKHCSKCDVVFCEKCKKEWKVYSPSSQTWGSSGVAFCLTNCSHKT